MTKEEYIARHQHDLNADALWEKFVEITDWVNRKFIVYRREMASVNWGWIYNRYRDDPRTAAEIEAEIARLMQDEEVTKKVGIFRYVFTRDERDLSLRAFTDAQRRTAYEQQHGRCADCGAAITFEQSQADHIIPWSRGGRTIQENCRSLCGTCNNRRGNRG